MKTRHAPSRYSRDARVYGNTTTATHQIEYLSLTEYTPPPSRPRVPTISTLKIYAQTQKTAWEEKLAEMLQIRKLARRRETTVGELVLGAARGALPPPHPDQWLPKAEQERHEDEVGRMLAPPCCSLPIITNTRAIYCHGVGCCCCWCSHMNYFPKHRIRDLRTRSSTDSWGRGK